MMPQCMLPAGEQCCLCHHRSVKNVSFTVMKKEKKISFTHKTILYIYLKWKNSSVKGDLLPVNLKHYLDILFASLDLSWLRGGEFSNAVQNMSIPFLYNSRRGQRCRISSGFLDLCVFPFTVSIVMLITTYQQTPIMCICLKSEVAQQKISYISNFGLLNKLRVAFHPVKTG